jgi:hypothetical protein
MHPEVRGDRPGVRPKCGMALEPGVYFQLIWPRRHAKHAPQNQQKKADAADDGEGSPVIKYGRVSDLILKEPRNDARH